MTQDRERYIRRAIGIARRSRNKGNHPFGALLVGPDGKVVLEAENTVVTEGDCTGHAETNLIRQACRRFDQAYRSRCTLYTSTEPCAMCSGAIYWAGVARVVFGLREEGLYQLTGDHPENPTLRLPCRELFRTGSRPIEVVGPLLEEEAREVHQGFWRPEA